MENDSDRNHAPAPTGGSVPSTTPAARDANGFDPTEFELRPVPRRPRRDGWTPEVQQRFIAALARTGVVERACEDVNMSVTSAYTLRHAPGAEGFAHAWRSVLARAADRMLDVAFEHAIIGEEVPVFDRDGIRVGAKRRVNTRVMMFMLKAYFPEHFRQADKATIVAGETPPPAAIPVADAVASLAPVTPENPHLLATPERLDDMIYGAQALANYDEHAQPSERQPYRAPPVPEDHPNVVARSRRNRRLRDDREERQDRALGLNFASTYDDDPPRDPLSDYTYWIAAEKERERQAALEGDGGADDVDDEDETWLSEGSEAEGDTAENDADDDEQAST